MKRALRASSFGIFASARLHAFCYCTIRTTGTNTTRGAMELRSIAHQVRTRRQFLPACPHGTIRGNSPLESPSCREVPQLRHGGKTNRLCLLRVVIIHKASIRKIYAIRLHIPFECVRVRVRVRSVVHVQLDICQIWVAETLGLSYSF